MGEIWYIYIRIRDCSIKKKLELYNIFVINLFLLSSYVLMKFWYFNSFAIVICIIIFYSLKNKMIYDVYVNDS